MNDNDALVAPSPTDPSLRSAYQDERRRELINLASRAVLKPEGLTFGEVQELGWAFLMWAKNDLDVFAT